MVKAATCEAIYNGHCNHWALSDGAHALAHAQGRQIDAMATADKAAGVFGRGTSTSSVADDGPALERFLADEGYAVVPAGVYVTVPIEVAARHRPTKAYFDAEGHAAIGQAAVEAAAAGRAINVCSCELGAGCDVMRILLGAQVLPMVRLAIAGAAPTRRRGLD